MLVVQHQRFRQGGIVFPPDSSSAPWLRTLRTHDTWYKVMTKANMDQNNRGKGFRYSNEVTLFRHVMKAALRIMLSWGPSSLSSCFEPSYFRIVPTLSQGYHGKRKPKPKNPAP